MEIFVVPEKHKGPFRVFSLKGPPIRAYPNPVIEAVPFGPDLATKISGDSFLLRFPSVCQGEKELRQRC